MSNCLKLSSPETRQFWEIPVLFEDAHLLALDKPVRLLTAPDPADPERPSLMALLHAGIAAGKPWAKARGLSYLTNVHRLDFEATGVLLLAKDKTAFLALANLFGADKPVRVWLALVRGSPPEPAFEIAAPLLPDRARPGLMRVDEKKGKRARTGFEVVERFDDVALLKCRLFTDRVHQVRVHLRLAGLPVAGDVLYGGRPLLLSRIKPGYRLKEGRTERPLIATAALHSETLTLPHPITGTPFTLTAPWPKDLTVAVKYLRRYIKAD